VKFIAVHLLNQLGLYEFWEVMQQNFPWLPQERIAKIWWIRL